MFVSPPPPALLQTLHPPLSPNREVGGVSVDGGVSADNLGGATARLAAAGGDSEFQEEKKKELQHLTDDNMERADATTFQLPGFHSDEAELELAL